MGRNGNPRLPNFLIVGANRCGTMSLYHYLKEHPEVFMSRIKEPSFFLARSFKVPERGIGDDRRQIVTDFENYCQLFEEAGDCKVVGEASTENLYHWDKVIPNVQRLLLFPSKHVFSGRIPLLEGLNLAIFDDELENYV